MEEGCRGEGGDASVLAQARQNHSVLDKFWISEPCSAFVEP